MSVRIRAEAGADRESVWKVNRSAFGTDIEANLVDALRDGGFAKISLVAEANDEVVGHIVFSQVHIVMPERRIEGLALAPLAVLPAQQRGGIGSMLVVEGLAECKKQGHTIVTVLGHPRFYPRFGFSAELARPLNSPFGNGEAWMALELRCGSLSGVAGQIEYAPPFAAFA